MSGWYQPMSMSIYIVHYRTVSVMRSVPKLQKLRLQQAVKGGHQSKNQLELTQVNFVDVTNAVTCTQPNQVTTSSIRCHAMAPAGLLNKAIPTETNTARTRKVSGKPRTHNHYSTTVMLQTIATIQN